MRQEKVGVEPCYFREEIWSYYLATIRHSSYWLSYDELLAVATIAHTQLIIVQEINDIFHYCCDNLDRVPRREDVEPVIVSIRGGGQQRIESHFERLLLRTNFESVVREERQAVALDRRCCEQDNHLKACFFSFSW